jgi:hypothetical protein
MKQGRGDWTDCASPGVISRSCLTSGTYIEARLKGCEKAQVNNRKSVTPETGRTHIAYMKPKPIPLYLF